MDEFRKRVAELPREEILKIIEEQNPELIKHINRMEWVFAHKLGHLTWSDGRPITGNPLTHEELALLVDEPFNVNLELTRLGMSVEEQREYHIAKDPVEWARYYLKMEPRAYQILIMRHPNNRRVLRAGRRLGKTIALGILMLHHAYTHNHGRILVMAPMRSHIDALWQGLGEMLANSPIVSKSITRKITSPQYMLEFSNGSSVKFFATGVRSGGKADVTRGQEAHLIILDEMDYMGPEDLDAVYAMLQQTSEKIVDKILVAASTPTGRREKFWDFCHSPEFKEYWYPSYVNPYFKKENEIEFRAQYSEMAYRHEIEADWGEDTEGVYPRRYVDQMFFGAGDWNYIPQPTSARSFFVMGVDWDKVGAGVNIVVLEACNGDYEDPLFANKIRLAYREEVPRGEYTLTDAVERVKVLNGIFQPRHIYVDRGNGEVQVELLQKWGMEHPRTELKKRLRGVSFSETIEIRDPVTKQPIKKEIKPFMVDNFRQHLEEGEIFAPTHDEEFHLQLLSYVVQRVTPTGRPVYEGLKGDHVHDALILALLAITQNYGELMKSRLARHSIAVSNETFLAPTVSEDRAETHSAEKGFRKRAMSVSMGRDARQITRKIF